MEKFEQFRKQTSDTIKDLPKSERGAALKSIKDEDSSAYEKAGKLQDAKRDIYKLSKTETLIHPENPTNVAIWVKAEIETYIENQQGYIMGDHIVDVLREIGQYLAKRLNVQTGEIKIREIVSNSSTTLEDNNLSVDELRVEGEIELFGKKIFEYTASNDGSWLDIKKWYDENLTTVIPEFIEYLKNKKV